MLAIAIHNINASYELMQRTSEYVLVVPGRSMAEDTMCCGIQSLREMDKPEELRLEYLPSEKIAVPGLQKAIANVEMVKQASIVTGDHVLVIGRAVNFRVRPEDDLPLLSIGPNTDGYELLAKKGIHRIGCVKREP